MTNSSQFWGYNNDELITSGAPIDDINARFYERFQYPWPPSFARKRLDPSLESAMLSQSVGEWTVDVLPAEPEIWVAGCGTNQAVLTALRFPEANVLGTDVSAASIDASTQLARQLGVTNLELRVESINEASYTALFDYVISTGVIHHNADPGQTLMHISDALRPEGVLELMVYNRYHCIEAIAVQKAVRIFVGDESGGFESGLEVAVKLVKEHPELVDRMQVSFSGVDQYETAAADALIQPVMHSYTVSELEALAHPAGLALSLPCVNQFDLSRGKLDWDLDLGDPELRASYDAMPDTTQWQVTNLLELDRSPMLWFYLRKVPRRTEREILSDFAETSFTRADTRCEVQIRDENGEYLPGGAPRRHPDLPPDPMLRSIVEEFESRGSARLADVLADLDIPTDSATLSRLRIRLATTAFPYLQRVDASPFKS